ncbi:MAG: hypothetical protein FWD47_01355 [Treponema sp.]|nr:hypothetical protein [Treponema sp.]
MKLVQIVKPGLFVYECVRFITLTFFLLLILRNNPGLFIVVIFAVPLALFPLMALFLWLDTDRFRAYLPLFLAGKCIGIIILLIWSIISKQDIIVQSNILCGDLLSFAAVLLIIKDLRKTAEPQSITDEVGGG